MRGTTTKACEYNATNELCVPTGQISLHKGNIIDIMFGISPGQVVKAYYGIFGN
jgi:hypothetical protein